MIVNTQFIYKIHKHFLPKFLLKFWIKSLISYILQHKKMPNLLPLNINLRFVDNIEGQNLNKTYRHKDYATNVLTFVYKDIKDEINADIILCCDVIDKEAKAQNKAIISHYAHLIIHGVLHAIGYTHETEAKNEYMQNLEIEIMQNLGFNNPYL